MENSKYDSLYEAFRATARTFADKPALVFLGRTYTYSALEAITEHFARALYHELGVRTGDKALIYQPHAPQWIITWLALQRIGVVGVPVTHFYGPGEIEYIANDSGATVIFCMDTNFGYVTRVLSNTSLQKIIVGNVAEFLPSWKRLVGRMFDKIPEGKFEKTRNVYTYKDLLRTTPPDLPNSVGSKGEEIAELLYTGGTTGLPKGIPMSHVLFLLSTEQQRKASEGVIPRGQDVVIQGSPLYHILGQQVGIGALLAGDTLILLPRNNLDAVFDHIARYRGTTLFGTPTLYRMILEHDRVDYYNMSSLRYCFGAGDALPPEVDNRWLKKFKIPICQGYGATESCGGVSLTPAGEAFPPGTVGKIIPLWEPRLVDPDTLETAPPLEAGELLVSSRYMVRGYWNKPEETAERFIELDGKLWYRTGDIMRIDQDGWVFFLDRSVDIIKHKGYRVAASRVERILQEHPAVVASCVVGVLDPRVGERIKAFVVLKEDVKGVTASELIDWCRGKLASYEVPGYIEFRDMLPKSRVGKLLRRELRAEERRKLEVS